MLISVGGIGVNDDTSLFRIPEVSVSGWDLRVKIAIASQYYAVEGAWPKRESAHRKM